MQSLDVFNLTLRVSEEETSEPMKTLQVLHPSPDTTYYNSTVNNVQSIIAKGLLEQFTDPRRQSAYDMRNGIVSVEQAQLLMLFLFIRILNPTFFFFNKNKSSMTICPRL